jgi:hypothetical protein
MLDATRDVKRHGAVMVVDEAGQAGRHSLPTPTCAGFWPGRAPARFDLRVGDAS